MLSSHTYINFPFELSHDLLSKKLSKLDLHSTFDLILNSAVCYKGIDWNILQPHANKCLSLNASNLKNENFNPLFLQQLYYFHNITSLDLSNNTFTVELFNGFLHCCMNSLPNLKKLYLIGLDINDIGILQICKSFQQKNPLDLFVFSSQSVTLQGYAYLEYYLPMTEKRIIGVTNPPQNSLIEFIRFFCESPYNAPWRMNNYLTHQDDIFIISTMINFANIREQCFQGLEYLYLPELLFNRLLVYDFQPFFQSLRTLDLSGCSLDSIRTLLDNHIDLFPKVNQLIIKHINTTEPYLYSIVKRFLQLPEIIKLQQTSISNSSSLNNSTNRATLDLTNNPMMMYPTQTIAQFKMIKYLFDMRQFTLLTDELDASVNYYKSNAYDIVFPEFFGYSRYNSLEGTLNLSKSSCFIYSPNNDLGFKEYDWKILSLTIPYLTNILSIDLSGYESNEEKTLLKRILALPQTVVNVILSNCNIQELREVPFLLVSNTIETLNLSNNCISELTPQELTTFVMNSSNLRSIDLSNNNLQNDGYTTLFFCNCLYSTKLDGLLIGSVINPIDTYYQTNNMQITKGTWEYFQNHLGIIEYDRAIDTLFLLPDTIHHKFNRNVIDHIPGHAYLLRTLLISLLGYSRIEILDLQQYQILPENDILMLLVRIINKHRNTLKELYLNLTIESNTQTKNDYETFQIGFWSNLYTAITQSPKLSKIIINQHVAMLTKEGESLVSTYSKRTKSKQFFIDRDFSKTKISKRNH